MKKILVAAILGVSAMAFVGCASKHQEGVKSSYLWQSIDGGVSTDPAATTDIAKTVLEAEGLKNVTANSTAMDGKAKGSLADGRVVDVTVKKKDNVAGSDVSVKVGTIGDPAMGAEIAKKIKVKADGPKM